MARRAKVPRATAWRQARVETGGFFVEPTVFGKVAPQATLAREEVFGPVLAVISFKESDEAIRLASGTVCGLPLGYGPVTSVSRTAPRGRSRLGLCGLTAGMPTTSLCPSAA